MKGTSKVIMGAALVMVLSLAIVLGLVLVLLVELYCSILFRRRQLNQSKADGTGSGAINIEAAPHYPSPLSSFYAQGVLQAPRGFLFQSQRKDSDVASVDDLEMQHGKLHEFLTLQTALESAMTSPSSPPPPTTVYEISEVSKPQPAPPLPVTEQLVYICNPIYENVCDEEALFETPDTSPTRLSCVDEIVDDKNVTTPPLTPIKLPPTKASLGTSGSESNSTQNAAFSPSISGSHSTSSW